MPRMDGTGPIGQGPRTGRGLGPCGLGLARGNARGRGWIGRGLGLGLGLALGWRRGSGWVRRPMDPADAREVLKARQQVLEEELEIVRQQLAETDSADEQA